jgi:hypothetical protein
MFRLDTYYALLAPVLPMLDLNRCSFQMIQRYPELISGDMQEQPLIEMIMKTVEVSQYFPSTQDSEFQRCPGASLQVSSLLVPRRDMKAWDFEVDRYLGSGYLGFMTSLSCPHDI